jgi:hypothetical protein
MVSPDDLNGKTSRRGFCVRKAMSDGIAELSHHDPAKADVMKHIDQLVASGFAELDMLDNGDIELRFRTGEMFLLKESVMVRLR